MNKGRLCVRQLDLLVAVGRNPSVAQLVFNLSTVSVPVCSFQVDAGTMLYRVDGVIVTSI